MRTDLLNVALVFATSIVSAFALAAIFKPIVKRLMARIEPKILKVITAVALATTFALAIMISSYILRLLVWAVLVLGLHVYRL